VFFGGAWVFAGELGLFEVAGDTKKIGACTSGVGPDTPKVGVCTSGVGPCTRKSGARESLADRLIREGCVAGVNRYSAVQRVLEACSEALSKQASVSQRSGEHAHPACKKAPA